MSNHSDDAWDDGAAVPPTQPEKASDRFSLPARRALPELVAERLIESIASGALQPGERLVESTLAANLGVSRAPLREAFRQLEAQGLVETRNAKGTWVRGLDSEHLEQMLSVRALLEGLAARLVASRGDAADIAEIARVHERFEAAATAGEPVVWRQVDWEFHEAVCRLSRNPVLLEAWRSVSTLVRLFLHKHRGFKMDTARIVAHHREFMDALTARDADRAEALFRSRILTSGYQQLGRPLPDGLATYVTVVDDPLKAAKPAPKPKAAARKPARRKR